MALRLSPIVGIVGLGLIMLRLRRLLLPAEEGLPWSIVLMSAVALGVAIIWFARLLRLPTTVTAGLAGYITLAVVTVVAGVPSVAGIPTTEGRQLLVGAFTEGYEQFTLGSAPVLATSGLLLILMIAFVLLGLMFGWSTSRRQMLPLYAGIGIIYAIIAVVDKGPSRFWLQASVLWVASTLLALSRDDRFSGPRVLGKISRAVPLTLSLALVIVSLIGVGVTNRVSSSVGLLDVSTAGGLSGVSTGISYNLFASSIQTNLVSTSNDIVFEARVSTSPVPNSSLYWRIITLDEYDGVNWFPSTQDLEGVDGAWENPDHAFAGETATVQQVIRIRAYRNNYLPALYSPTAFVSDSSRISNGISVRDDGSLRSQSMPFEGNEYRVRSSIPVVTAAWLARAGSEDLTFLNAAVEQGLISPGAVSRGSDATLPALDRLHHLALPSEMDPSITALARSIVTGTTSPLERTLLLEAYFREGSRFEYTLDIDPGHAATDLQLWLLDPESDNYRRGYCEQFATAMAAMARSVGLPSRIALGFTPGEQTADGTILVRGKNAHAWVEVWLDGVGWMRFDPTPRGDGVNPSTSGELGFNLTQFAAVQREAVQDPEEGQSGPILIDPGARVDGEGGIDEILTLPTDTGPTFDLNIPAWAWRLFGWLAFIFALPVLKQVRRKRRIKRALQGDITAAWTELVGQLKDTGLRINSSLTAEEVVAKSVSSLAPLAYAHTSAVFSPDGPTQGQMEDAIKSFGAAEVDVRSDQTALDRIRMAYSLRSIRR